MNRTIEVEITPDGSLRPMEEGMILPRGRAYLTWQTEDATPQANVEGAECLLLSEAAFSDWLRPEEDEAWGHLQPVK